jgi:hypothetical protein
MSIAVHPYNMGQPHRARHLHRALEAIVRRPGVWLATGGEIADWYEQHYYHQVQALCAREGR